MSQEEGHIGALQGVFLAYALLSARLFVQYPGFLIATAGPAAWQVAIVATATAAALILPTIALARRFPRQSLAEISEAVAGPFFGSIFTLAVVAWLFITLTLSVRNFTEAFITALLPGTPPSVLSIVAILCMIYASYRGLEPLARAAQVLFPIIALGILGVLLFSLPRAEVSRLFPIWGYGLQPTLMGGLVYGSIGAEAVILLTVGYAFRSPKVLQQSGLFGILFYGITLTATLAVLVMVFGAPDAQLQSFPMFTLARLVYLGRFVQRTEALIVMFWFFAAIVRLSVLLHALVVSLRGILRIPLYHPLLFPVAVMVFSLSLLPHDFISILRLDRQLMRPAGFVIIALPLALWLLALIRRKGGQINAA